jgi:CO/xanthine dehydrogenase Mo-binding subunit
MALSWVCSEHLAVDADGEVHDLTIRSFGILKASEMPEVDVVIEPSDSPPVNGSDAVFAAVAAAAWLDQGCPPDLPTGHRYR